MSQLPSPTRLDASFADAPTVQKAQRLMATLNAGNAELFRGALDVFDWCVQQVQQGRHIAAIDKNGGMPRELVTPLPGAARDQSRIALPSAAFDKLVYVLDRPSKPTPALRKLMAKRYGKK